MGSFLLWAANRKERRIEKDVEQEEERLENKAIKCCFVNSCKTNGKHRSPSSTTTILKDSKVSKHDR